MTPYRGFWRKFAGWSLTGSMSPEPNNRTTTLLSDDQVLVAGGTNGRCDGIVCFCSIADNHSGKGGV
jgi:hypothetical protein